MAANNRVERLASNCHQSSHASTRGGLGARAARLRASIAAEGLAGLGRRMPNAAPINRFATVESRSGFTGANKSLAAVERHTSRGRNNVING